MPSSKEFLKWLYTKPAPTNSAITNIEGIFEETPIGISAPAVSPVQGVFRGSMCAIFTTLLNPLDKFLAIHTTTHQKVPTTLADNLVLFATKPFKGAGFNFGSSLFRNTLIFGSAPFIQKKLENRGLATKKSEFLAYTASSIIENTFWTPFAVCRQYIYSTPAKSCLAVLKNIPKQNLVKASIKNWLWGNVKNSIFWPSYIAISKHAERTYIGADDMLTKKSLKQFAIGSITGVAISTITYPLDVIQKNLIMRPEFSAKKLFFEAKQTHGTWPLVFSNFAFKGYTMTSCRMVLMMGFMNSALSLADRFYDRLKNDPIPSFSSGLKK